MDTIPCQKYLILTFPLQFWFQNSLILFGGICRGVASNETWIFNTLSGQWTLVEINNLFFKPVGTTGHTATVVGQEMIVLFGFNPEHGFVNRIQVFNLGE